jgi:hypothetical protein
MEIKREENYRIWIGRKYAGIKILRRDVLPYAIGSETGQLESGRPVDEKNLIIDDGDAGIPPGPEPPRPEPPGPEPPGPE